MSDLVVNTKYGLVEGVQEECIAFKGIPYAKAPIGDLRFRAPQKPDAFEGVYKADKFGNRSVQLSWAAPDGFYDKEFPIPEDETPFSEDSLYLNIFTPKLGESENMPVMVYFHGGGFIGGYGHEIEFLSSAYAKKNVILVTANYRLGILGFLAHPWLTKEDEKAVGNYATLDVIEALSWVKENIAAFGGNPDNVTVFGQSAGAMMTTTLLCSKAATGTFEKAIIQSGSGYPNFIAHIAPLAEAEEMGIRAMEQAGIGSLEELRKTDVAKLLEIQNQLVGEGFAKGIGIPFAPVVNGYVLGKNVNESIESGLVNNVPVIIGGNKNDITVSEEEAQKLGGRLYDSNIAFSLKNEEVSENPAYVYYFKRDLPGDDAGAFHSAELWYTMGTYEKCWRPFTEEDEALSEKMVTCWTNFGKCSDPNGDGIKEWRKCTASDSYVQVFDI